MSWKKLLDKFVLAEKTLPCPQCNGKKFLGKGRCRRCGGVGFVPASWKAHK